MFDQIIFHIYSNVNHIKIIHWNIWTLGFVLIRQIKEKMKHLMNPTTTFCTLPMPKSIICIWFRSFPMKWLYTFWNGMVLESTSYIWVGKFDNYSPISSNMMYHFSSYLLKLQGIFFPYILLNDIISFISMIS